MNVLFVQLLPLSLFAPSLFPDVPKGNKGDLSSRSLGIRHRLGLGLGLVSYWVSLSALVAQEEKERE